MAQYLPSISFESSACSLASFCARRRRLSSSSAALIVEVELVRVWPACSSSLSESETRLIALLVAVLARSLDA